MIARIRARRGAPTYHRHRHPPPSHASAPPPAHSAPYLPHVSRNPNPPQPLSLPTGPVTVVMIAADRAARAGHVHQSYKLGCCLSRDDSHVLGGSEDGSLHVWDLVDARCVYKLRAHAGAVSAVSCDPSRDELLTASHDGAVKLWEQPAEGARAKRPKR